LRLCVFALEIHVPSWLKKKGRNYKTNPIFVASFCRLGRNEGKISNSMISKTHGQSGPAHGGDSPFKAIETYSSDFEKRIVCFFKNWRFRIRVIRGSKLYRPNTGPYRPKKKSPTP
jgi:hypothetical protein